MVGWRAVPSFVATLSFVTTAYANEVAGARLSYSAPEDGCPDEASFRDLVAARLGENPFADDGGRHVDVRIAKETGKLRARFGLTEDGTPGPARELTAPIGQCEALAAALAASVALVLDDGQKPSPAPPPVSASPPPPAAPLVVYRERDVPSPEPPPVDEPRVKVAVTVAGVATVGLAPRPTVGPEVGVVLRRGAISFEVAGRAELAVADGRASTGERLDASVLTGGLASCLHASAFSGCAWGRAGAFDGRSPDVVRPIAGASAFGAVGMRGTYALATTSRLSVRGSLEVGLPLVRTSLTIEQAPVWTAPPIFVGASLGGTIELL